MCPGEARQRARVPGPVDDDQGGPRFGKHRREVSKERFTNAVNPLRVLNDVYRRVPPSQHRIVDEVDETATPSVRTDVWQRPAGVLDTEQVIEQNQILT